MFIHMYLILLRFVLAVQCHWPCHYCLLMGHTASLMPITASPGPLLEVYGDIKLPPDWWKAPERIYNTHIYQIKIEFFLPISVVSISWKLWLTLTSNKAVFYLPINSIFKKYTTTKICTWFVFCRVLLWFGVISLRLILPSYRWSNNW